MEFITKINHLFLVIYQYLAIVQIIKPLYIVILDAFNAVPSEENLLYFCNLYNLKNLVKESTCYKNPHNPPYTTLKTLLKSPLATKTLTTPHVRTSYSLIDPNQFRILKLLKLVYLISIS